MIEDNEILISLKNPDLNERAFGWLVKKYQERLYWHIRRMVIHHDDTHDVLQNVFVKAWKNLPQFRQESSLYTWLYKIATNETITFINNKNKKTTTSLEDNNDEWQIQLKAQQGFDGNKIEWQLQQAIHSLPEKQKIIFCLRYYDEMPYHQMSEVLDTSVGALKASYHHALKKMEQYLIKHCNM